MWEVLNLARLLPSLWPHKDQNLFPFRFRSQKGSFHKNKEGVIRDRSDNWDNFENIHIIPALSLESATLWASADLKHCLQGSFAKVISFHLRTLAFPHFDFMKLHTHTYLWLWGGPHSDPHCKGLNSYHSQEFLGPQGFIGFRAILSHFIPSIWFKCFITNSWLFLRRRERTGEVKQHLSLKQENMLVCISCQIWGMLAGSWWFGHISDFRVNFTELYCLPLDPHWRTRCQAYLPNCTCDQSAAPLGTSQVLPLHCVVSFTPSVLLERHSESSAAFYSQRWGVNGMKEPDVIQSPCQAATAFLLLLLSPWAFFTARYF